MTYTYAPVTDRIVQTDWGRSRDGAALNGLVIHHQANGDGQADIGYMIGYNDRGSHPTYAIDNDSAATVTGIIHPDLAPSSTGYDIDQGAVTIEVANIGGAPDWPVSDAAVEKIAQIIAHHAGQSERAGHPVEVNDPDRTQAGFWVAWHSQYYATACPGDHLRSRIPAIVARANEIRGGAPVPTPTPAPASGPEPLEVDGALGAKTIRRWQEIVGTPADGVIDDEESALVEEVQRRLNAAGARDWDGRELVIDGEGIYSNVGQSVGKFRTIWALQAYLGTFTDGYLDADDSSAVRALQTRLNEGRF